MAKQSSTAHNQPRIAVWLAPAPDTSLPCTSAIRELAERFGGPSFEPHVTIACESLPGAGDPAALLDELASLTGGVNLEPSGIHAEACFTKSLFVRYRPSRALSVLRHRVREIARIESPAEEGGFDPHLSLMYAPLPLETRLEIASSFDPALLRLTPHHFDHLVAISVPGPVQSSLDVQSWEVLAEKPLVEKPGTAGISEPAGAS